MNTFIILTTIIFGCLTLSVILAAGMVMTALNKSSAKPCEKFKKYHYMHFVEDEENTNE